MAITTRDGLIAAMAGSMSVPIYKASVSNMAAGYICSLWRAAGSPIWQQGAIPTSAATPTDETVGGIDLPSFGSNVGYVLRFAPIGATAGTFRLYDRLAHMGGLSGTVTTAQTVNLDVATARSAGRCRSDWLDVEWHVEIYTDIGTTAANLTVTYTDVNDTGSKTITITGFSGSSPLNRAGRCVPLVPTDGIAIKSIQTAQLSTSSGTGGNFGVTARRRIAEIGQALANILAPGTDPISLGLPEIKGTSCLEMLVICSTTSTGLILGSLNIGQG